MMWHSHTCACRHLPDLSFTPTRRKSGHPVDCFESDRFYEDLECLRFQPLRLLHPPRRLHHDRAQQMWLPGTPYISEAAKLRSREASDRGRSQGGCCSCCGMFGTAQAIWRRPNAIVGFLSILVCDQVPARISQSHGGPRSAGHRAIGKFGKS